MKKETAQEQSPQTSNETAQEQTAPYSRFNEPVNEKPGLGQRVSIGDESLLSRPIDEVQFKPPPVEKEVHPLAGQQQGKGDQPKPQPGAGKNEGSDYIQDPNLKDLPPAQKEAAAEQLARFILSRYQNLHDWGNKKVQISEKKIWKYVKDGRLDLRALVPYELDQWMTIGEFIKEYNKEYGELFFIDPAWRAEIEPPLTRILAKRGLGMSDEMLVGLMFMQDLGVKVSLAFEAFAKTNSVIQFAVEQTARMRGVVQMPQRPRPTPTEPPMGSAPVVNMPTSPEPAPTGGSSQGIPIMITSAMRHQLYELGYNEGDIDIMTPQEAHDCINAKFYKPTANIPVQDRVMGDNGGTGTHAMSDAVVKNELPKWGPNADKLNRRVGRPAGSKNKKAAPKKSPKKKRA